MNIPEKTKKAEEEGTMSASKPKVRRVESDEDDSHFECYNKSDTKPVQVENDKEFTEESPALALAPNKCEERYLHIHNNVETIGGNSSFIVRKPN